MDCSMPSFPVHHQLPELAQTHVHRVGDAIQPSHPLSSPSPRAFSISQHQGLFQWVSSLYEVELQLEHQSFQWTPSPPLGWTGCISLQSKGLSRVFSNTTVQKHQFFGAQLSLWSNSFIYIYIYTYIYIYVCICIYSFPGGLVVKNLPANAEVTREVGSISGLGRSPGGGNGNPLQYSCLENSRGAWQAAVHGVIKSWTEHTCTQSSLINTTSYVIPSSSLTF